MNIISIVKKFMKSISTQSKSALLQAESILLRLMSKMSKLRNIFYAFLTCIISSNYVPKTYLYTFVAIFIGLTIINFILVQSRKYPKIQGVLKKMLVICMIISILLVVGCLLESANFVFGHFSILQNIYAASINQNTKWIWKIFGLLKLLFLPISTIMIVYRRIKDYCNMSDYKNKIKYNLLTGEKLKDSPLYDARFPFFKLIIILTSLYLNSGMVVILGGLVDIVLDLSDFAGHKMNNVLLQTVMSCIVSLYVFFNRSSNIIKTGNINAIANTN